VGLDSIMMMDIPRREVVKGWRYWTISVWAWILSWWWISHGERLWRVEDIGQL